MKMMTKKKTLKIILALTLSFTYILGGQALTAQDSYFDQKDLISPYSSWGINPTNPASINLLSAWMKFEKKKNVVVAVVDTGVDYKHDFIANNIFVPSGKVDATNFGVDFSKNKKDSKTPTDTLGHGTHISGILRSINPEVKLLELKFYAPNADADDNLSSTLDALKYAIDQNVDIINYSAGGSGFSEKEFAVLKEAEKKGILVIAAAGNKKANIDDKETAFYPASYGLKNVITVAAHDDNLQILPSSNYGVRTVDIFAPGFRIKSSMNNGRSGFLTGTSQATAFVAGVASLIKAQHPSFTNQRIKDIIKNSAKKEISFAGKCITAARLDAGAALSMAIEQASQETTTRRQLANIEK